LPRVLRVAPDGRIAPYGVEGSRYLVGDLAHGRIGEILEQYEGSARHRQFLDLSRRAHLNFCVAGHARFVEWGNCLREANWVRSPA